MKKDWKVFAGLLSLVAVLTACGTGAPAVESAASEAAAAASEVASEAMSEASEAMQAESSPETATKGTALEDGVLDLGTNATFPPFEYYEGDQMVGIDVDLAQAIADELGYELKMHDMEFNAIVASIESGRLDGGIAGMSVTPERQASVNFTENYFDSVQLVIVPKDSDIASVEDLQGKKVGTQLGTTSQTNAVDILGEENVQTFTAYQDAILAMQSGKVDAVICDEQTAMNFASANDTLKTLEGEFAGEHYAIALTKDNAALMDEVNGALKTLQENGKVQEIIDKYTK